MEKRCGRPTKKGGKCRAWRVEGQDTCLAHADEKTRDSVRFGGRQEGSGRPRNPRPTELLRDLAEAHALELLRPHFAALGLELHDDGTATEREGAIRYVWAGPDEAAVKVEDLGARIAAAEKLLDRVYGKPRQAHEVTGKDGGPIDTRGALDLTKLTNDELDLLEELNRRAAER